MKRFFLFALVFSLLLPSCAPATQLSEPTVTPTKTPNPTATATPPPTFTPTPVPLPASLLAQKEVMEQKGYIFGEGEITQKDAQGKEWEVVKFNSDGRATIRSLDNNYRGSDLILPAEEAVNITVESLNAGHDQIFAVTDKVTGKVTKIFLPNIDKSAQTEAGWIAPLEISQNPHNPTKLDNAAPIHTRHVLYSALLGKGSEPWPEDFPKTTFYLIPEAQILTRDGNGRMMDILLDFGGFDSNGKRVPVQTRDLGFVDVYTPEGWVIFPLKQFKISDDGLSMVLNAGLTGKVRTLSNFYDEKGNLTALRNFWLYIAFNYSPGHQPKDNYIEFPNNGSGWLYMNDPDNRPWELEGVKEEVDWLNILTNEEILSDHGKTAIIRYIELVKDPKYGVVDIPGRVVTFEELLDKLQEEILL